MSVHCIYDAKNILNGWPDANDTRDVLPDVVEQKRIKVPDGPQLDNSVRKQKGDSGPQEAVPAK